VKKIRQIRRMEAIIPTASMADIAFLLIIFFMVTTVHDVDRTDIALPSSVSRYKTEQGASYVVLNNQDGGVVYKFSDGKEMSSTVGSPNDIYLEASRITRSDAERQFVIKADHDIRYYLVDEILDKLREAGVQNVLLLTHAKAGDQ
jgi:biopolymer transport protein ExbD